jgi:hypothetical protein
MMHESELENYENVKKQAQLIIDNLGNQPKILDIGCGRRKRGNIGLDLYPFEGVDIVWNVTRGLPFPDNALDGIYISCLRASSPWQFRSHYGRNVEML